MKEKIKAIGLSSIVFLLMCLLLIDSVMYTGGRLFSIGPITYRMILVLVSLLCIVPFCFKNFTKLLKSPYVISIVILYVVLAIGFIRAIILKQDLVIAIEQLKGFFWLLLLPIMLFCVTKKKHIDIFLKIIVIGGTILSLAIMAVSVIAIYANDFITPIYYFCKDNNLGMLYMATERIPRLLLLGIMAQILACCFSFYFYLRSVSGKTIYAICAAINLIGILQTYTRGVYLGAFAAAVFVVVFLFLGLKDKRRRMCSFLAKTVCVFAVGVIALSIINSTHVFSYGVFRVTLGTPLESIGKELIGYEEENHSQDNDAADDTDDDTADDESALRDDASIETDVESNKESLGIRAEMKTKLNELIAQNPVFGNGLGAAIELRDGRVEMVYHDVVSKIGFLGLAILLLPFLIMICKFLKLTVDIRRQKDEEMEEEYMSKVVLLAALIGIMVSTYTNPYFLNSLGLFIYCLAMRIFTNKNFELEV